ncbi:MAG TPA: ribosome silencing factor [bacterium]|nr:ribosome silencing factor [bacterium]
MGAAKSKSAAPGAGKARRAGAVKSATAIGAKRSDAAKPSRAGKRGGMLVRASGSASVRAPGASAVRGAQRKAPLTKPALRKPAPRLAVDDGIGPVEIAPPKDAPRTIGIMAAEAAMDKKAFDVVVLDVRGISGLCDEMVVASARSVTHLSAVCDGVEEALRLHGERVLHSDGRHSSEPDWILLDYGDLMVHLFRPEARLQTRLEDYYASARLVAKWKND